MGGAEAGLCPNSPLCGSCSVTCSCVDLLARCRCFVGALPLLLLLFASRAFLPCTSTSTLACSPRRLRFCDLLRHPFHRAAAAIAPAATSTAAPVAAVPPTADVLATGPASAALATAAGGANTNATTAAGATAAS